MSKQTEYTPPEIIESTIIDQIVNGASVFNIEPSELEIHALMNMAQELPPVSEEEKELRFGILSVNYRLESKLSYDERHFTLLSILKSIRKNS